MDTNITYVLLSKEVILNKSLERFLLGVIYRNRGTTPMSICQLELLLMCRAKLAKEASSRNPHLSVIVGHANLLAALISGIFTMSYELREG